ncbi:MAG TPA: FG-GAP-like repeat-containing protein [Thermoleophilia bacterium]|nr:FG-GAP-like repeat-containing protein [Thermoleophilia bacterium]
MDYTEYSSDSGATWARGVSVTVSAHGVTAILYRSVDKAAPPNVEVAKTVRVKMLGVALYAGGDVSLSANSRITSPLVDGQPSAALYAAGAWTASSSADLSTVKQYVKAKGDAVPPMAQFISDARIDLLTQAARAAQRTGTVYKGLRYSSDKNVTFTAPITIEGDLVISGSGTYTFASAYVTGNVAITGNQPRFSFGSLYVGGSLKVSGGTAAQWGPTYVVGDTSLSGNGQWNVGLLVVAGNLTVGGSQTMGGTGVGAAAKPAIMLLTGQGKTVNWGGGGTFYGLLCNRYGSISQGSSGPIRGSVLCAAAYSAGGGSTIAYDPNVARLALDAAAPTTVARVSPTPNSAGWDNSDVTVTLSVSDDPGGSGVAATYYAVDGGARQTYSGPVALSQTGAHMVTYWSQDNAGNVEASNSLTIRIDKAAPVGSVGVTPAETSPEGLVTTSYNMPALTFSASDVAGGSGLDAGQTRIVLDGSALTPVPEPGDLLPKLADGSHRLVLRVRDLAGNEGVAIADFSVHASRFTITPAEAHEGDVVGLYADGWDTAGAAQTWRWTVAKGQPAPDTYEGPVGFIVPDDTDTYDVGLTVTDNATHALNIVSATLTPLPQPARVHALDIETLAGRPAGLFARLLDPGWTDTHTAMWMLDGQAVSGAAVTEDNVGAMDTGLASATTLPLAPGVHQGSLTVSDADAGGTSTTQSFTVTAIADDPVRDEGAGGNGDFARAAELRSGQVHLSYVQAANDVDIFEVMMPDGSPLPYGTEVLVTLRDLPADFDLAVVQDLGQDAAVGTQKVAFEDSAFASSAHVHSPWEDAAHVHSPWEEAAHVHSPYLSLPFADAAHVHSPFLDAAHVHSPFVDTALVHSPVEDAAHVHSPFLDTAHVHSPFLWGVYVHAGGTPENSLDGYPLSQMSYAGLGDTRTTGTNITFEELGYSNEEFAGKRIAGFSATPGLADEVVLATTDFVGGHTYIAVKGANGVFSDQPYALQVETSQPVDIFSLLNNGQKLPPLVANGSSTTTVEVTPPDQQPPETLFVTQADRVKAIYGVDRWNTVLSRLQQACESPLVRGEVISVPASIYDAWDEQPWRPDLANGVTDAIRAAMQPYLTSSVKYVVLVGSDHVVPQRRVQDQTVLGNERAYADTAFLATNSSLFGSMYQSTVLSDDFYVDSEPVPFNGRALYIPDVAVSRLVEKPSEIAAMIDAFLGQSASPPVLDRPAGRLDGATAVVTGQDFMTDGAQKVQSVLVGSGIQSTLLPVDTWTADDARQALLATPGDIGDINAHFTHFGGISASGYNTMVAGDPWSVDELLTGADIAAAASFNGKLVFSMGCHAGLNVPDYMSLATASAYGIDPGLDIAQAIARKGGVLVASTGYGFGDTETSSGTEALVGLFADQMTTADGSAGGQGRSIGLALAAAKRQYLGSLSVVTPYDEKSSIEFTMYGMPQYRLPADKTHPASGYGALQPAAATTPASAGLVSGAQQPSASPDSFELTVDDGGVLTTYSAVLEERTGADGTSRFFSADGDTQTTADRPIQPRVVVDLGTTDTRPATAALVTGGTFVDLPEFNPAISRWVNEWQVDPQEFQVATKGWWPATTTTVKTIETATPAGGLQWEQRLVVVPGQFQSTSAAGEMVAGTERVWTSLTVQLVRRPAGAGTDDTVAPTVRSVHLLKTGDTVAAKVDAFDASGISRIDLTHEGGGTTAHFSFFGDALVPGPDGTYVLRFDLPGVEPQDVAVKVMVMDGAGNVTTLTAKATGVPAVEVPPPTVAITSPADGSTVTTATPQLVFDVGGAAPGGLVVKVDGVEVGTPSGGNLDALFGGQHTVAVTATDALGNQTTATSTFWVELVPPAVTAPNGGERWALGSTQTIAWTPGNGADVTIELSRDNGSTWTPLFTSTANDGSESWTVSGSATSQARVRISNLSGSDVSDACFTIGLDYTTAARPEDVAVGDFNGDGKLDLVSANSGAGSVSILLGRGDGTFQASVDYATGAAPCSVATGDFNHDGKVDLAIANSGANTVSVLRGNGDGTFRAKVDYRTGSAPRSVDVRDIDGDGRQDVVTANSGANTVTILHGNGNGTFQNKVDYPTDAGPWSVEARDVNGDLKQDLVTANSGASSVSVLLGNGNGTFQARIDYPTGSAPRSVDVGDLNGDGKSDLVTANSGASSVSVLLGKGGGTFQAKVDYLTGSGPESVAIGDLNGDGEQDVVTANSGAGANAVSVLSGRGDGTLQPRLDYIVGATPRSVAVADLNGDGKLDLVTANYDAGTISVLLGAAFP